MLQERAAASRETVMVKRRSMLQETAPLETATMLMEILTECLHVTRD